MSTLCHLSPRVELSAQIDAWRSIAADSRASQARCEERGMWNTALWYAGRAGAYEEAADIIEGLLVEGVT